MQSLSLNDQAESQPEPSVQEIHPDEAGQGLDRCVWQQQHQWQTYLPPTPDSYLWSPNSTQPVSFNFGMKPMVASAPVTPDVIPYHGKYLSVA